MDQIHLRGAHGSHLKHSEGIGVSLHCLMWHIQDAQHGINLSLIVFRKEGCTLQRLPYGSISELAGLGWKVDCRLQGIGQQAMATGGLKSSALRHVKQACCSSASKHEKL